MKNSRRTFIKKSAIGTAAITMGGMGLNAQSYRRIIGANERINVAVVGLGRRLYLAGCVEGVVRKESNTRLVYLCDVMENQRTKAAERFSQLVDYRPALENDVRKIFADKNVDALFNFTPDHWHTPGTCYALQAGKHVYVEKPSSHNPREGEILIAFQKKYGHVVQVGNQGSSVSETAAAIKEIHNGIIGVPYKAIAFYSNVRGEVPLPRRAPVPDGLDWGLFQGPAPRQEYMHDTWDYNWHWYGWTYGTGEAGNNAIHRLDFARRAMQVDFPERVDSCGGKYHFPDDGWTMYDTLDASLVFPGNKIIKIDSKSRNRYPTYGSAVGTIIYGTEGSMLFTGQGYRQFDRNGRLVSEGSSDTNATISHMTNFYDSIRGKATPNSPVEDAEKSTLYCHLANISYRIGRGFDVDCRNGQALDRDALKLWSREYEPGWEPKI
jgi:predicted dehydrogenase